MQIFVFKIHGLIQEQCKIDSSNLDKYNQYPNLAQPHSGQKYIRSRPLPHTVTGERFYNSLIHM